MTVHTYEVTRIEWETDGESVDLPDATTVTVEVWDDGTESEVIAEELSERYGWLVIGFQYEVLADNV